jgi:hypothetical protein
MTPEQKEERRLAYNAVARARLDGSLVKQSCEVCGNVDTHAHHRWGYETENALRVAWLCHVHHSAEHLGTPPWHETIRALREWTGLRETQLDWRLKWRRGRTALIEEGAEATPVEHRQLIRFYTGWLAEQLREEEA